MLRLFWKSPWWMKLALLVGGPLALLNGAVGYFGHSHVFPLSPFWVPEKVAALKAYAQHRPLCVLNFGDDDSLKLAARAERVHGLPRGLMQAVVAVESAGEPHRISPVGAMGPAQLMPGTARMLGVRDPFDPATSIDAGARYLKQLLERNGGNVSLAVAAYNAGPGAVNGRVPHNGETEFYVARVLARLDAN